MKVTQPAQLIDPHIAAQIKEMGKVDKKILDDRRTRLAFGKAGTNSATRSYVKLPNQMAPGILSTDRRYARYLFELDKELSQNWPASVTANGFSLTGVTSDFSSVRSISGWKMSHANAPIVDADALVKEKGLATGFLTPRHERLAEILWDLMFSRLEPNDARLSTVSSSTVPDFTKDIEIKQYRVRSALKNIDKILELIDGNNFHELLRDHAIAIVNVLGERAQPDGWKDGQPKVRQVSSPEDALRANPRTFAADKVSTLRDLFGIENVAAMRIRTVYAMAGTISYLMTCFMSMARGRYFKEYEFTWHHTTGSEILRSLQERGASWSVGVDVTQMDQHVPSFFLDFYADKWSKRVDPRLAKIFRLFNRAPYYAPQLTAGGEPYWAGNPFDIEGFTPHVGLSSGRPDNPDIGKYWMTFVYLVVIDDLVGDVLEFAGDDTESVDAFLKGQHTDVLLKALGDDAIIVGRQGGRLSRDKVAKYLRDPSSSKYALLDVEDALAFLGNIGIADSTDQLVAMEPNPVTEVTNWFAAEHGIWTPHRQYWGEGLVMRLEHYSSSSTAVDVWRQAEEIWRRVLPDEPTPQAAAHQERVTRRLPLMPTLSQVDMEVLLDSSKLYYKFDPEQVSATITDLFSARVDGDVIFDSFKHLI